MALELREAMLELAKMTGMVMEGVSTGGSTTTLVDSEVEFPMEKFTGGTIWILSGTYIDSCMPVIESASKKFTWATALAGAVLTGTSYAVAQKTFSKQLLMQAINFVLGRVDIIKIDDTTVVASADEYTLPTGVKNVKRVYVASEASNPYGWIEDFSWQEVAGKLIFQSGKEPTDTGKIIRLVYLGKHGAITETGATNAFDATINEDYVLWSAAKHLWRTRIETMGKDDPQAFDFFNEAIQESANQAAVGKSIKIHKAIRGSGF